MARTVRDATYALDIIVGIDGRDNYTAAQKVPAGGYAQFLSGKGALQGAVFGLPWESFWTRAEQWMVDELLEVLSLIEDAGGTIVNGTELPHWKTIVNPRGWDWLILPCYAVYQPPNFGYLLIIIKTGTMEPEGVIETSLNILLSK